MTELRQRQPRICEPKYLAWLRKQPCACGCGAPPPSDAAHLRSGSPWYFKEYPGFGAKPDDRWATPLNRSCHMRQHAHGDEVGWWIANGIRDPFGMSIRYYAAWFAQAATELRGERSARPPRKAKTKPKTHRRPRDGKHGAKAKIPSRPFPKKNRKFRV